jgi:hypothetical protein
MMWRTPPRGRWCWRRSAGRAMRLLVCEREPSDLLATMIHEFGPIEPYFRE